MNKSSYAQLRLIDEAIKNEVSTLDDIRKINLSDIAKVNENIDITIWHGKSLQFQTGELYNLPARKDVNLGPIVPVQYGDMKLIYLTDEIKLKDNVIINIQLVKDMYNETVFLHALSYIMLGLDILILIIAVLVGFFMSKKVLKPIDKITFQAKQISASDLTKRIELNGPDDELKRMADTFNDLIERIQHSYEKQNQFTLDASHEMATPLAVIKGYVDLIDRWGKNDSKILDEGIQAMKTELSNMTKLLDTLLFLSKGDNDLATIEKEKFSLDELIMEVVKESRLIAPEHKINSSVNSHIDLKADRRLIKQMLRAIIDNSIKYSPENGKIEIKVESEGDSAVITISDNGMGITDEEKLRVFDRFYRVDKSRSRDMGGTGLGLSIVNWIVEIHGGSISIDSKLNEGTKMIVRLPING